VLIITLVGKETIQADENRCYWVTYYESPDENSEWGTSFEAPYGYWYYIIH
jgi:hypothetical protein